MTIPSLLPVISLLLLLAAQSAPAGAATEDTVQTVPAEGRRFEQAVTAALMTFVQQNADRPALDRGACVGYVSPAAGPPEVAADARHLFSLPGPLLDILAAGRKDWSPLAICQTEPGITVDTRVAQGPTATLLYCEGITEVAEGWSMYCGTKGPGPSGRRLQYQVSPVEEQPGTWRVSRPCEACVRY
ncbi:hypothetical protein [Indioceanicola profundi]|uniref:hypothetical protein n=1 Tax=Indioceanicola profundi TaxID=2220096 RepID=UPI000E6AB62C|nr:hypothetical protein [Indioceanicola profundi]